MDMFSSVVIAIVFLSGVSVGAAITSLYRNAVRNRIQHDFQRQLDAIIAERERAYAAHGAIAHSERARPPADAAIGREEPVDEEMEWIPSTLTTTQPHASRL